MAQPSCSVPEQVQQLAGWGAAFYEDKNAAAASKTGQWNDVESLDMHGPVSTDPADPFLLGVTKLSHSTAVPSAIEIAAIWILKKLSDESRHIFFYYDSQYAANMAMGVWQPE